MSQNIQNQNPDFINLMGDIVAAYVSSNSVRPLELPDLIRNIHAALTNLSNGNAGVKLEDKVEKPTPAQIRKSVTPSGIVSFLDGKTYQSMKRHLASRGLDPQSYRQRYGLPADYPVVAPGYAARRSELAKSMGLGRAANREEAA